MGATYSSAQKKAANKYLAGLDEMKIRLPKGEKERIKLHAAEFDGGSINAFVRRAIWETVERDKKNKQNP